MGSFDSNDEGERAVGLATSIHDLKTLVLSFHPVIVMETVEERRASSLLAATATELSLPLFEWTITQGLRRVPSEQGGNAMGWTTDAFQLLAHLDKMTVEAVYHLMDFTQHLDSPTAVRQFREVASHFTATRSTLVLSGRRCELPGEVAHVAVHFDLQLPTPAELRPVIRNVLRSLQENARVRVDLGAADLDRLGQALSGLTLNQARQAIARAALAKGRLDASVAASLVDYKADALRENGLLEYYPAEDNRFELGGFAGLKAWLERARVGFSARARELSLSPPRGLLLAGVQGCGKSLAAKCIARVWQLPLVKLEAGRLFDKYVGETEKNFRRATALAETMAPVVLWIDEIEKAFSRGGESDVDGGLSRRLFGAFLTWLQEKKADVFVVATANDIWSLPPELLRKGRFDEIFFVDLPDAAERREIFEIHLRNRKQDPRDLDLAPLVQASEGMSGAEIEQAVISALYEALHRNRSLDTPTVLAEVNATIPLSVSRREDIEKLRRLGRERFVPVR